MSQKRNESVRDCSRSFSCGLRLQEPAEALACFFKSQSPEQLAETDEELEKVLKFKMRLESEMKQLFGTFPSTGEFETLLRRASWSFTGSQTVTLKRRSSAQSSPKSWFLKKGKF